MRLAIFSLTLSLFAFVAPQFAAAQTTYIDEPGHQSHLGGSFAPGPYYAYRAPMNLGYGVNATWGYNGTCCDNVWDGYCGEQRCRHCQKGSFWCKLKCSRINIFGKKQCGCQHGGCNSGCGHCCAGGCSGGCGSGHAGGTMAPSAAEYDSAEPVDSMPLPPQTRSSHASPLSKASRSTRNDQPGVRQNWSMPRMSSTHGAVRR
jgi:hypothetical protein